MANPVEIVVVVGAGLAGAKTVERLRHEGHDGEITLIGDERERPYERPLLSKGFLHGSPLDEAYVHDEDWYARHEVDTLFGSRATLIDPAQKRVVVDGVDDLSYDNLVLATGARPRRLDVEGGDLPGILTLRTAEDAERIRRAFEEGPRVVCVGGGFIASEVAAAARQRGLDVTIVLPEQLLFERTLGRDVGAVFTELHRQHGVALRTGAQVVGFDGADAVAGVRLADGQTLPADLVVLGVGVVPNDELAAGAALEVDQGIVVDEFLQASDPQVWAVGDVASAWHPVFERRLRVEHWANALNQPSVLAKNMTAVSGGSVPYDRVPYAYTDQFELSTEIVGLPQIADRVVFRGDPRSTSFSAFWLAGDRVVAAMPAGGHTDVEAAKALIAAREAVDADALADPDVALPDAARH